MQLFKRVEILGMGLGEHKAEKIHAFMLQKMIVGTVKILQYENEW